MLLHVWIVHLQDKGLDEAFWPIYEVDERPEKTGMAHWLLRVLFGLAICLSLWGLHSYVPDKGLSSCTCSCAIWP